MTLPQFLILVAAVLWFAGMSQVAGALRREQRRREDALNAAWERHKG